MAGFLVDAYCLGIKNAMYRIFEASEYAGAVERIFEATEVRFERQHPAYARKLVEGAVAYARDLGFDPHPDYKIARAIFGDVDASGCPVRFTFGEGGKPFYVSGPDDTPVIQRRILKQLENRCGSDGFHFTVREYSDGFD